MFIKPPTQSLALFGILWMLLSLPSLAATTPAEHAQDDFRVQMDAGQGFRDVGFLPFGDMFTQRGLSPPHAEGPVTLRLIKQGDGAGHIDMVRVTGPGVRKEPFRFPVSNRLQDIAAERDFYRVAPTRRRNECFPRTPCPARATRSTKPSPTPGARETTCAPGWNFQSDNTLDGGEDYASLHLRVVSDSFVINDLDNDRDQPSAIYVGAAASLSCGLPTKTPRTPACAANLSVTAANCWGQRCYAPLNNGAYDIAGAGGTTGDIMDVYTHSTPTLVLDGAPVAPFAVIVPVLQPVLNP